MAISTISVTANTSTISVDTTTNTVSVTSTPTTVSVGTATQVTTSEIRGALSNVSPILYNSTSGVISFDGSSVFTGRTTDDLAQGSTNKYFSTSGAAVNTDALTEGSTNKYFTPARVRSNISVTDSGGLGSLAYNSGTGVITYTGGTDLELRDKISVTDSGGFGSLTYSNASGVINFTGTSTTDVRGSLSAGAGVTYNSGTGVISALGLNSTSSSFATEGVMANVNAIYPTGRQYSEAYDVGISYDSSTGGFSVAYPQKSFHARFKNTAIDTTRGHVLAVTGYDASNDIPIVDYLDTTLAGNSIVAGVYMESLGTVSNSAVSYPKVAVATQGYITSGAYNGLSGLKTGDILYATKVGSRGGYTSTIPTNTYNGIVDPIGKIVEQDGTLYTLYIDVTQPAIDTSNISLTQGSATQTAGRPVIGVSGSEIEVGTSGSAGLTVVNRPTGHRINLSLNSITGVSDVAKTFEVSGSLLGNNRNIALQDINLANLDNQYSQFSSNAQTVAHIATTALTVGGNITVNGNINATGNINTQNIVDLNVQDQQITLNANAASSANVFIISNRPGVANTSIKWNEQTDKWQWTNNGTTFYNLPESTSELAEGTNLYYTDGRFDTRLATKSTSDLSEGTNLYYTTPRSNTDFDARLASKSTSNLSEGTNLYYTVARANTAITDYDGVLTPSSLTATGNIQGAYVKGNGSELSGLTTTQVSEGTNLYYTTARANSAIADYTGTISTGNTISGTTVTATTELKTNQVKPNSSDSITLKDANTLEFDPIKQNISYNAGRINQVGTVINRQTAAIASEVVTAQANLATPIGSNYIGGLFVGSTHGVVGGAGGSITFTEGSTAVDIRGLQTTGGSNYLQAYGGTKAFANLATYFRPGQVIGLNRASGDFMGPQQKDTVITAVVNSNGTNGHANVTISKAAKYSETFTVAGTLTDTIAVTDQVSQAGNTNIRAIHGISPTNFVWQTNSIRGMMVQDYQIEGTSENGANYFNFMTDTTLSQVDASVTPQMMAKGNVTDYYEIINMESDKGFYRFPDTVLIGDQSGPESRNNYRDTLTSFGVNVQWSGLDTDARYPANTVQPALVFQNFTDNALQSQSGQEDRAGPRILLSSFTGNKNNPQLSWYPRQNQEIGKYGWWSTSGEDAVPSGTIPSAAITGIAAHNWDTSANVSIDVIGYARTKTGSGTPSNYLAFLDGELELSAHGTKKIKFGESGLIGNSSSIRTDATQTTTYATVDATETELFNRLQLHSLTTTEINALSSPQAGQVVYNSTLGQVCVYSGVASAWQKITQATM
jgi:hypothetical protein